MTAEQLRQFFNDTLGNYNKSWPETYEVDAETYSNICQFIFTSKSFRHGTQHVVQLSLGKNNGVMYKGVELLLKKEKE